MQKTWCDFKDWLLTQRGYLLFKDGALILVGTDNLDEEEDRN